MAAFVQLATGEYVAYFVPRAQGTGTNGVLTPKYHATPECPGLHGTDPATLGESRFPEGEVRHLKSRACKKCAGDAFDEEHIGMPAGGR